MHFRLPELKGVCESAALGQEEPLGPGEERIKVGFSIR